MRGIAGLMAVLVVASWLAMPVTAFAATMVAVIAVKGMVCNA